MFPYRSETATYTIPVLVKKENILYGVTPWEDPGRKQVEQFR